MSTNRNEGEVLGPDPGNVGPAIPVRVRGMKLFFQQFKALMIKNALLAWRNRTATFLQLCSSFFFILLIFLVDVSVKAALTNYTEFRDTPNPNVVEVQPIMACENAFNILTPCYDFLWSGNNSKIITSLVQNISANNPGRPINSSRIIGFANPSDVDVWLLAHPMRTPGALHFAFTEKGDLGFAVQTNSTSKVRRGTFENPTFDHQVPLQAAAEREIARYIAQDWTIGWQPSYSEFAHPPYQSLSAIPLAGPTFLFAAAMFNFVTQAANLVIERELKLRQAMATMGLMDSVFWSTWLVWELIVALVTCILLICFGMIFQLAFFLKNSFVVLFLVFFLFWVAMTGLAFLVSTFMRKSANANTIGFFIFLLGFVLQLMVMFGFPYTNDFSGFWRVIFSLFPPDLLTLSLKYLTDATKLPQSPGVSLSEINKCTLGNAGCTNTLVVGSSGTHLKYLTKLNLSEINKCTLGNTGSSNTLVSSCHAVTEASIYVWLIGDFFLFFILAIYFDNASIYVWLIGDFFLFFILAIYFDNVLPDANGIRKPIFYFFYPSFWTGKASFAKYNNGGSGKADPGLERVGEEDEDVREEEELVKGQAERGEVDADMAVSVRGLVKTFPKKWRMKGLKCKVMPPFHAIKGTWFNVEKDKLFCLLGPNGAGKSTTIHCLTGILPTTAGDGLKNLYSIRDPGSMAAIRAIMGVCPQFDILWSCDLPLTTNLSHRSSPSSLHPPLQVSDTGTLSAIQAAWRPSAPSWACLIYGHSIRDPGSMAAIRAIMGVCPQFDILWDRLTSQEHLYLFARIKGLLPSQIPKECSMLLEEVKLTNVTRSRTSGYSGGMKRRLSVAIALIGDPKIVFLDEPTTGMDPVSRRHVWDIIERAKRGRAIVLTTHSMEEADILGDRIAIMAKGRMRCIGTSIHLKNRFGAGFVVTVGVRRPARVVNSAAAGGGENSAAETSNGSSPLSSSAVSPDGTPGDNVEAVKGFFYDRLGVQAEEESQGYITFLALAPFPLSLETVLYRFDRLGVQAEEESQGYITFLVPRSKETMLTTFFRELKQKKRELGVIETHLSRSTLDQQKKRELGVTETHLSLSTLEEVFLTIARKAELETAQVEERFEAITLVDGRTLQWEEVFLTIARKAEFETAQVEERFEAITLADRTLQVPIGAECVAIPPSASANEEDADVDAGQSQPLMVVDITWHQDEAGCLRIASYSEPRQADSGELNVTKGF
ncbi:unnamed protein product [Closterium sp. NIES-64]|nr:unnamed protein product [Closterium sp. NIES-64]